MEQKVPVWRRPCTTHWWCDGRHTNPEGPHVKNLDLIEHLDNRDCLIEVNARIADGTPIVQVLFTDMDLTDSHFDLTPEAAGLLGYIIRTFDQRGVLEFGNLLYEGFQLLAPQEELQGPFPSPFAPDPDEALAELTDEHKALVLAYFRDRNPLALMRAIDAVLRNPQ